MNNNEATARVNVVSPLPFSTMTNGIDLGSNNLFPSLSHVNNDVHTGMDTFPTSVCDQEQNLVAVRM